MCICMQANLRGCSCWVSGKPCSWCVMWTNSSVYVRMNASKAPRLQLLRGKLWRMMWNISLFMYKWMPQAKLQGCSCWEANRDAWLGIPITVLGQAGYHLLLCHHLSVVVRPLSHHAGPCLCSSCSRRHHCTGGCLSCNLRKSTVGLQVHQICACTMHMLPQGVWSGWEIGWLSRLRTKQLVSHLVYGRFGWLAIQVAGEQLE